MAEQRSRALAAAVLVLAAAMTGCAGQSVPAAWFCRVWQPREQMTGPACVRMPAAYRPPWPYLGPHGSVIYPSPRGHG